MKKGTHMKTGYLKEWQKMTHRKKAQAMIEFALVLPILLLVVFGIFEFGHLLYAWIIIENATASACAMRPPVITIQLTAHPGVHRIPTPTPHGFHRSKIKRVGSSSVCLTIKL